MEIFTDINNISKQPCVATIGSFDGVHRGHKYIISQAKKIAIEMEIPLTIVTFAQHPRIVFGRENTPFLLTPTEEKLALLDAAGAERCILLPFDKEMAKLSAREFMQQILCEKTAVKTLAIGYDHRFGRPQEGEGFDSYALYGKAIGIDVVQMQGYSPDGLKISSSMIRRALTSGDCNTAATLLGRNYSIAGTVVHGAALGRKLGFPTANIQPHEPMQLLPPDGVYECIVPLNGIQHKGVMNIGRKPTVENKERTLEVYILDFNGDIYDTDIRVEILHRLRGERRFNTLDELRLQIEKDVHSVKNRI